jgi:hypothetical protein
VEIYEKYLPLVELMRGKKWVLHARALTLPPRHDGNIFETRDGNYVVNVMSQERSMREGEEPQTVTVRVRLPEGVNVSQAELMGVDFNDSRPLELRPDGDDLLFEIPRYSTAVVAKLTTT